MNKIIFGIFLVAGAVSFSKGMKSNVQLHEEKLQALRVPASDAMIDNKNCMKIALYVGASAAQFYLENKTKERAELESKYTHILLKCGTEKEVLEKYFN